MTPVEKTMLMVLERMEKLEEIAVSQMNAQQTLCLDMSTFMRMANYRGIRATIKIENGYGETTPKDMLTYIYEEMSQERLGHIHSKRFPSYAVPNLECIVFPDSETYEWSDIKDICLHDLTIPELNSM